MAEKALFSGHSLEVDEEHHGEKERQQRADAAEGGVEALRQLPAAAGEHVQQAGDQGPDQGEQRDQADIGGGSFHWITLATD
jgi:IS5 family transposase